MKINVDLRVNILCIISWLCDFCLTTSHTHLAVVKIGSSFTQAGTDSCVRVSVCKYRAPGGHGQKLNLAHILSIDRYVRVLVRN